MIIIFTFILIIVLTLLNGVLANLYNKLFPISTKGIKCILLIPPMAILLWLAMIVISVFIIIQRGLETYFKEGDE